MLVWLLTTEHLPGDADMNRLQASLATFGADTTAVAYLRRMRSMKLTGKHAVLIWQVDVAQFVDPSNVEPRIIYKSRLSLASMVVFCCPELSAAVFAAVPCVPTDSTLLRIWV